MDLLFCLVICFTLETSPGIHAILESAIAILEPKPTCGMSKRERGRRPRGGELLSFSGLYAQRTGRLPVFGLKWLRRICSYRLSPYGTSPSIAVRSWGGTGVGEGGGDGGAARES